MSQVIPTVFNVIERSNVCFKNNILGKGKQSIDNLIVEFTNKLHENGDELPKKEVLNFCDLVIKSLERGEYLTLGVLALALFISERFQIPIIGTLLKAGAFSGVFFYKDLVKLKNSVKETRAYFSGIDCTNLYWNLKGHSSIRPELIRLCARVQSRSKIITSRFVFGPEIKNLVNYCDKRLAPLASERKQIAQVKWVPDNCNDDKSPLSKHIEDWQKNVKQLVINFGNNDDELLAHDIQTVTTPIFSILADINFCLLGSTLAFWVFSRIWFSTFNLVGVIACGFFLCIEMDNVHDVLREKIGNPLAEYTWEEISWDQFLAYITEAVKSFYEDSWLMKRSPFLGNQVARMPDYLRGLKETAINNSSSNESPSAPSATNSMPESPLTRRASQIFRNIRV